MTARFLYILFTWVSLLLSIREVLAQDSTLQSPIKYIVAVEKRANDLTASIDKKTNQYLNKFKKGEVRLLKKLAKKDSTKAAQLLAQSRAKYQQLEKALKGENHLQEYIPSLDTLTTSLKFLSQHKAFLATVRDEQTNFGQTLGKVEGLKSSLGKAEAVHQFLQEQKAHLATQLKGLPLAKQFKRLHKHAYYYKAQVDEYKALLKDKSKWEKKALELLSKTKAFQSFMRKNSQLASLFRLPGIEEESIASLEGLQTRAQVNHLLQERFGGDPSAIAQLKENVQAAQGQLNTLKAKAESLKTGSVGNGGTDLAQPHFKPNSQKTKSFFKRLEVGTNLQSQKARYLFPVTADLGLSLGYRLTDKSSVGVGGSYKVGIGTGWQHIQLTHEGVGLRSYADYHLKGSLFLAGGYERNYRSEIKAIEQLNRRSAWQASGLVGLTKKYQVSKKLKGQMQLLWDFLSHRQVPRSQAVLFRIGYSIK
ncbi:MAG TPA: hypothetical protein VD794_09610 [Flavisolibacter sp.]|nr:hypothetical protein [Flavisolibacter sp.]